MSSSPQRTPAPTKNESRFAFVFAPICRAAIFDKLSPGSATYAFTPPDAGRGLPAALPFCVYCCVPWPCCFGCGCGKGRVARIG